MSGERLSPAGGAARRLARLLAGALLLAGCTRSSQATVGRGAEVVVFVDVSGSVKSDARALFAAGPQNPNPPSLVGGGRHPRPPVNHQKPPHPPPPPRGKPPP